MSAQIETTNGVLAGGIQHDNPGSVAAVDGDVWTVTHADRLVVTATVGHRAGYSLSYSVNISLAWATDIRDVVADGHIALHDLCSMVIEDGAGDDADFVASYGPTGPGARSRFPVGRDDIVIGIMRDLG